MSVRAGAWIRLGTLCGRGEGDWLPSAHYLWATQQLRVAWPHHVLLADFPLPISSSILGRGWIVTFLMYHVHICQFLDFEETLRVQAKPRDESPNPR